MDPNIRAIWAELQLVLSFLRHRQGHPAVSAWAMFVMIIRFGTNVKFKVYKLRVTDC